jgi:hypothetical protein
MARFTVQLTDSAPGEITIAFDSDPPLPDPLPKAGAASPAVSLTPAQRAGVAQFGECLKLLDRSPYPRVLVDTGTEVIPIRQFFGGDTHRE